MYKNIDIYIYTLVSMCLYTKSFKVYTGKAETHVISHNLSSYTKVSVIRYMYTCGYMYRIQRGSKCEGSHR